MRSGIHEAGDPRQFSLIDLFALTTLAALVSAMAAPLLRGMQEENRERLIVAMSFQIFGAAAAVAFAAHRRGRLLDRSGRRIGVGYGGSVRWRHWPVVKSSVSMLLLAIAQLLLAALFTTAFVRIAPWGFYLYELQLAWFFGVALARYRWRVYPNAMEFFENGIALNCMTLIPWRLIELRPSLFIGGLEVLIRPVGSRVAHSILIQVSDALRDRLLAGGFGRGSAAASPTPAT